MTFNLNKTFAPTSGVGAQLGMQNRDSDTRITMTEQTQSQQNQNPEQLRDRAENYQEKLLNQYSELIAQNTFEASKQALNDQLAYYEALGVKKGFQQFKEHAQGLMQEKLEGLNQRNSQKILELRASTPDVEELDDEPALEAPSLESGINQEMQNYGVLTSSNDQAELPSDLSEALEA
jgi:hypothetical protein